MGGDIETIGLAEARSALHWWLAAGVDAPIQESARDWLTPPAPATAAPTKAAPPPNLVVPASETLAELRTWLESSAQLPLAEKAARRILPHGPEKAAIMLLSGAPALEDLASGQPIGGDSWTLTQRMLAAIGIEAAEAYSASLSCVHAPGAKMSETERKACADIARRHIALAQPARLLLLGDAPCLALLGKRLTEARGHVHKVEGIRTVATFHPRQLIQNSANKAYAWKDLLLLMEEEV